MKKTNLESVIQGFNYTPRISPNVNLKVGTASKLQLDYSKKPWIQSAGIFVPDESKPGNFKFKEIFPSPKK